MLILFVQLTLFCDLHKAQILSSPQKFSNDSLKLISQLFTSSLCFELKLRAIQLKENRTLCIQQLTLYFHYRQSYCVITRGCLL